MKFRKPPSKHEVLNDFDGNLINFWTQVRDNCTALIESFRYLPASREVFEKYKVKYKNNDYKDNLQRAHIYYYINRMCFGGDMKGPTIGTSKCAPSTFRPDKLMAQLESAFHRLEKVFIENKDFVDVIRQYDSKDTLFYIDLPYRNAKLYATGKFTDDQYKQLHDCCKDIQSKCLITLNNDPFIQELFIDFHQIDHGVTYSVCRETVGRRKFNELIITNYDVNEALN